MNMNRNQAIAENKLRRVKKTCYFCKKYDLFNMQCEQNKPTMEMDIIQDACDLFISTDAWAWIEEATRFISAVIEACDIKKAKEMNSDDLIIQMTYGFRCPHGHEFDIKASPDNPPQTAECPVCSELGKRRYILNTYKHGLQK